MLAGYVAWRFCQVLTRLSFPLLLKMWISGKTLRPFGPHNLTQINAGFSST
jgi:hypothetical protein